MQLRRVARAILAIGSLLSSATLPAGALPSLDAAQPALSLAGQLLVASPEIGDPRFAHAVILIVQHGKTGALGIVINRPVGDVSLPALMEAIGQKDAGISGSVRIFAGGPVEPSIGFIVHSTDYHRPETIEIDEHVAMTPSPEVLRDIGHQKGPHKTIVAFGSAGWGPGQLEGELALHSWFTIPEEPELVFDVEREKVWDDATARHTLRL